MIGGMTLVFNSPSTIHIVNACSVVCALDTSSTPTTSFRALKEAFEGALPRKSQESLAHHSWNYPPT